MRGIRLICSSVLALVCLSDQARGARVLEPGTEWSINPLPNSCELSRTFGEGADQVHLTYIRYLPGTSLRLSVGGTGVRVPNRSVWIHFQYGPDRRARRASVVRQETSGDVRWLIFDAWLVPPAAPTSTAELELDVAAKIQTLSLGLGSFDAGLLNLGPMDQAMGLMHECTDRMISSMGVDLTRHRNLSRAATPSTDPETWVTYSDYRMEQLGVGSAYIVPVLVAVDEQGKAAGCRTQPSSNLELTQSVCRAIMARASFVPALDADGQPLASYWAKDITVERKWTDRKRP
jgi:hypothetical protein